VKVGQEEDQQRPCRQVSSLILLFRTWQSCNDLPAPPIDCQQTRDRAVAERSNVELTRRELAQGFVCPFHGGRPLEKKTWNPEILFQRKTEMAGIYRGGLQLRRICPRTSNRWPFNLLTWNGGFQGNSGRSNTFSGVWCVHQMDRHLFRNPTAAD
jgi:hypothetical protein